MSTIAFDLPRVVPEKSQPKDYPLPVPADSFPPAPEIAAAIANSVRQIDIDRRKVEDLARLRVIQDRD